MNIQHCNTTLYDRKLRKSIIKKVPLFCQFLHIQTLQSWHWNENTIGSVLGCSDWKSQQSQVVASSISTTVWQFAQQKKKKKKKKRIQSTKKKTKREGSSVGAVLKRISLPQKSTLSETNKQTNLSNRSAGGPDQSNEDSSSLKLWESLREPWLLESE